MARIEELKKRLEKEVHKLERRYLIESIEQIGIDSSIASPGPVHFPFMIFQLFHDFWFVTFQDITPFALVYSELMSIITSNSSSLSSVAGIS